MSVWIEIINMFLCSNKTATLIQAHNDFGSGTDLDDIPLYAPYKSITLAQGTEKADMM